MSDTTPDLTISEKILIRLSDDLVSSDYFIEKIETKLAKLNEDLDSIWEDFNKHRKIISDISKTIEILKTTIKEFKTRNEL